MQRGFAQSRFGWPQVYVASLLIFILALASCGGGAEPFDPCAEKALPECPAQCPAGAFERCGAPCSVEGEACGNELGDGMMCVGHVWLCTVHAPLGTGCSRVCRAASASPK